MGPEAGTVLDLEARRRIVERVRDSPGLHLRALAESLGMPVSTLEYHCYHLVKHGHLDTRDLGGFKAFFPGQGLDRRDKDILAILRHDAPRRIATHLALNPGTTPGELKEVLGLSGPTLSFHLKRMRVAGLVREEAAGRTKRLYLTEADRVANVLVVYRKSFLDDVVDRFSEAWLALAPREASPPSEPEPPGPEGPPS
jgi:predicted transcriptional regulator